ncbi:hypothetical protein F2P81_008999 [Scophthalmus maximus]|uniref:Uncharacterized protein n=1 Tax=Scophthalmus maximus TaxID=52904 RepID=A0A6A4T0E8_SCOMX|nr:hypothetical protein F2P81_008999 [Scophthalmus maximus]
MLMASGTTGRVKEVAEWLKGTRLSFMSCGPQIRAELIKQKRREENELFISARRGGLRSQGGDTSEVSTEVAGMIRSDAKSIGKMEGKRCKIIKVLLGSSSYYINQKAAVQRVNPAFCVTELQLTGEGAKQEAVKDTEQDWKHVPLKLKLKTGKAPSNNSQSEVSICVDILPNPRYKKHCPVTVTLTLQDKGNVMMKYYDDPHRQRTWAHGTATQELSVSLCLVAPVDRCHSLLLHMTLNKRDCETRRKCRLLSCSAEALKKIDEQKLFAILTDKNKFAMLQMQKVTYVMNSNKPCTDDAFIINLLPNPSVSGVTNTNHLVSHRKTLQLIPLLFIYSHSPTTTMRVSNTPLRAPRIRTREHLEAVSPSPRPPSSCPPTSVVAAVVSPHFTKQVTLHNYQVDEVINLKFAGAAR